MARYCFRGFPAFLEVAAEELGRPKVAGAVRRNEALSALANLCAQAAEADEVHVGGILAKAAEFRDQLQVASRAAELMLAEVRVGRGQSRPAGSVARSGPSGEAGRRRRTMTSTA